MPIIIDQQNYIEIPQPIPINKDQLLYPHRKLNKNESSSLKCAIGLSNWLAKISRLEISYQVSAISSKKKDAINQISNQ